MHIVFITPGFTTAANDTVTIPLLRAFVAGLVQQQVKVTVLTLEYPVQPAHYVIDGADVFTCGGNNSRWPFKLFTLIKGVRTFAAIHKARPVTHIHSFWWQHTALLGNYLAGKYRLPHITTLMGQDVLPANKYAKWLPVKNNIIVAHSSFHAQLYATTFNKQVTAVIPMGITATDSVVTATAAKNIDVLGVGWLSALKNYSLFIDVIGIVAKQLPEIKCLIVGQGAGQDALQKQIDALHLNNNIQLTGLLPRSQVLQLMAGSKALLHTSSFESYGYVFIEAWANGMQVVSTPVGITNHTNAHIGNTAAQLAEKLIAVLTGKANIPAPEVPLMGDTVRQYIQLYQHAIA